MQSADASRPSPLSVELRKSHSPLVAYRAKCMDFTAFRAAPLRGVIPIAQQYRRCCVRRLSWYVDERIQKPTSPRAQCLSTSGIRPGLTVAKAGWQREVMAQHARLKRLAYLPKLLSRTPSSIKFEGRRRHCESTSHLRWVVLCSEPSILVENPVSSSTFRMIWHRTNPDPSY